MTELPLSELSGPGLRTFFNIARQWKMDQRQQASVLGIDEVSMLEEMERAAIARKDVNLDAETLHRIGLVLGIFKAINTLLPMPDRADGWMQAPNSNPIFQGRTALDRMAGGSMHDLTIVHQYLVAECGGLPDV
jgi:hypothetical protein